MKKVYEKPEVYSERLHIETLRAQCCSDPAQLFAKANGMLMPAMTRCHQCTCWEIAGPS